MLEAASVFFAFEAFAAGFVCLASAFDGLAGLEAAFFLAVVSFFGAVFFLEAVAVFLTSSLTTS
nr:hypothetical protein [Lachnospiraceae bacterium C1.1]